METPIQQRISERVGTWKGGCIEIMGDVHMSATSTELVKSARRRRNSKAQNDPMQMSVSFRATSCTQAVNELSGENARLAGVMCVSTHESPFRTSKSVVNRTMLPSRPWLGSPGLDVPATWRPSAVLLASKVTM